ncbi:MAG: hypothetical protein H0X66_10845 [Verrucomicrobia bacterium]|nr:hypothetical protein [Verrucomicrobiota bacterium]
MKMSFLKTILVAAVVAFGMAQSGFAKETTAYDLIKEGNKHVGEDAKGRVVEIRSEKSVGSLVPNIWYVVFYDPDATAKATEVKFGAGKKMSVKRPARILEFATGNAELDKEKMKVDSDAALETAKEEPLLKNVKLQASQMWLQRHRDYGHVWKVRFWAYKLRKPDQTTDVGHVYVSAETGKVVHNDLKINRID